jgi:hypothetical protein
MNWKLTAKFGVLAVFDIRNVTQWSALPTYICVKWSGGGGGGVTLFSFTNDVCLENLTSRSTVVNTLTTCVNNNTLCFCPHSYLYDSHNKEPLLLKTASVD